MSSQLGGHLDNDSYKKIKEFKVKTNTLAQAINWLRPYLNEDALEKISDDDFQEHIKNISAEKDCFGDLMVDFIEENTKEVIRAL